MKKILLLTGVLLALTASFASAAPGLDMAWGGCPLTPSNPSDITVDCGDDGALNFFYLAFKAPAGITQLVAETFILDVQTTDPVLPDWWHLEAGGCRDGSFAFSSTRNFVSTTLCKDYWGTTAQAGNTTWYPGVTNAARSRLIGFFARGTASAGLLTPDVEYFVGSGFIDSNHATPVNGLCNGCILASSMTFNYLLLQQPAAGTTSPNAGDFVIEAANQRRTISTQGGIPGDPTPTRRATWGQVKSLYR
jgi:hypothetical protein